MSIREKLNHQLESSSYDDAINIERHSHREIGIIEILCTLSKHTHKHIYTHRAIKEELLLATTHNKATFIFTYKTSTMR